MYRDFAEIGGRAAHVHSPERISIASSTVPSSRDLKNSRPPHYLSLDFPDRRDSSHISINANGVIAPISIHISTASSDTA